MSGVNIVTSDRGWVLERLARELARRLPYVTFGEGPDPKAAIQYYVTYSCRRRRLSPVEVENVLLQHPAVREAAIVAFKDADGLDKPRAYVALNDGHAANDELGEAIKAHVRATLEPFKAPRQVKFIAALPRSDRGKVLKTELRD